LSKLEPGYYGEFKTPPVVEVVFGVAFEPIPGFSTAFFGLLWNLFGEEFSKTTDQQPLPYPAQILKPGHPVRIVPATKPRLPRVWFMSSDERRIIQIQRDRFHYNWRRQEESDDYPRFPDVFSAFKKHYEILIGFDADASGEGLKELQYELTYVNHIPVSDFWQDFDQIGNVFPDVSWRKDSGRFLPTPVTMKWDAQFPMPDGAGVLTVSTRTARSATTGEPVITLDLTARGPAATLEFDDWFVLARQWIVKGFIDITDDKMQRAVWGKKE